MLASIGIITAVVVSIGSIIVSITTQLNHVKHIADDVKELKEWRNGLTTQVDGMAGDIKSIMRVCEERHRDK
jgi:hypothetical protein